jgi:drug/metabolite transporter (DMT)-like permease
LCLGWESRCSFICTEEECKLAAPVKARPENTASSLHWLGVICGLAAAPWLAGAEAPTKLVVTGLSPFLISLAMVTGVFVARWTLPTILKGTGYIFTDLRQKPHLIVWAVLAGALWAVGNTLTVFAVRDVGLSIAFPLWNVNSLVGVFWGWFFFRELRGAGSGSYAKVVGGAVAILAGAVALGYASSHGSAAVPHRAFAGISAAVGAGLMFGTMYIPYRKAYLSGMNPISFVTVFTVGEMITMPTLAIAFSGGLRPLLSELSRARPSLFWLFLGGFCWVVGDLFQNYAAKYIGIGRGIPLSNTNQLWGLAWGALVFSEFAGRGRSALTLVLAGSVVMILGAAAIGSAAAPKGEQISTQEAIARECKRYGLSLDSAAASQRGEDVIAEEAPAHRWWDGIIVAAAGGIFVWFGVLAKVPPVHMNRPWLLLLVGLMFVFLFGSGWLLGKKTRFS